MPAPTVSKVGETSDNRATTEIVNLTESLNVGDTLVILYGSDFYTLATMSDPTSNAGTLTLVETVDIGDNLGHLKAYLCPVTTGGSRTVTFPNHLDCDIHGVVLRIPAAVLLDVHAGAFDTSAASANHVAPSVTTSGPDRLLVCAWITTAGPGFTGEPYTVPGSMTKQGETGASPFSDMCVATEALTGSGATGTRTAVWVAARRFGALTLAVASAGQTIQLAQAVETDTAAAFTPAHAVVLGQAVEADSAQQLAMTKVAVLGQALELDSALPLGNLVPGHHTTSSAPASLSAVAAVAGLEATSL